MAGISPTPTPGIGNVTPTDYLMIGWDEDDAIGWDAEDVIGDSVPLVQGSIIQTSDAPVGSINPT